MTQLHITTTVKPPPANPDQPVPMVHANTQNNHTTLVIMSVYYGSQMLTNTMMGFDTLMDTYATTGTITEGQLYTALWPEAGLLSQASTIFGPGVISYIPARDIFSIRVGAREQHLSTEQMQHVTQALAVLGDTALARRAVYLVCVVNMPDLQSLIAPRDDEEIRLITYARELHNYVPDIDEQLTQIATAQHRPMRHGVAANYHQTSAGTQRSSQAATLPTYIGRDGGMCTSTAALYHGDKHAPSDPAADRIITTNPVVMRSIAICDLSHSLHMISSYPSTTVELRTVLAAAQS